MICVKFAQEGANVAINYNASEGRAKGVKERIEKDSKCGGVKAVVVGGVSISLSSWTQNSEHGLKLK